MHQALSLLLVLEMAYAAADVFPVRSPSGSADKSGDLYILRAASRYDPARAELASALGLEAPAVRLTKMLESEDLREEGLWALTETGSLGDRAGETEWRFVARAEENAREILRFEGGAALVFGGLRFSLHPEWLVKSLN